MPSRPVFRLFFEEFAERSPVRFASLRVRPAQGGGPGCSQRIAGVHFRDMTNRNIP